MSEKGGITIIVWHGISHGHESVTHFMHNFDLGMYENLPNLYAVCIADNGQSPRKIVGGFFAKTSYHHDDADFQDALLGAMIASGKLAHFATPRFSLLPARLGIKGSQPLTDDEMLQIFISQSLKHSTFGSA